jgi:hypothetical protein
LIYLFEILQLKDRLALHSECFSSRAISLSVQNAPKIGVRHAEPGASFTIEQAYDGTSGVANAWKQSDHGISFEPDPGSWKCRNINNLLMK